MNRTIFIILLCFPAIVFGQLLSETEQRQVDSMNTLLEKDLNDTDRVNTLSDLALKLTYDNPDTAIHYYSLAAKLSSENVRDASDETSIFFSGKVADCLFSIGILHANQGNYSEAIEQFTRSMVAAKITDNKTAIAKCYNGLGIIYNRQGLYDRAVENHLKSLRIYEEIAVKDVGNHNVKDGIAKGLNNLGVVYLAQKDYDKALKYYLSALEQFRELKNDHGVATSLNNIGTIHYAKHNYKKAFDFYSKSMKAQEKLRNKQGIAQSMMNMANVYDELGETERAIEYYSRSLKINKKIGRKSGMARNFNNIGQVHYKRGELDRAIEYGEKALALANEIGLKLEVKVSYDLLNKALAGQNDFKAAHTYLKLFAQIKDTLFNEGKSKEIGKLEAKYEFEKAEEEKKRRSQAEAEAKVKLENRRNTLQYSGILIFLVLVFASVFALGRISIPIRLAEGLIFFSFLLFFEFTLVLLDPYIEQYSSGAPAIKLGFNAILAALIFPLHSLFEEKFKGRLVK